MDRDEIIGIVNRYASGGVVKMAAGGTPPAYPFSQPINVGFWRNRWQNPTWTSDASGKAIQKIIQDAGGIAGVEAKLEKYNQDVAKYNRQVTDQEIAALEQQATSNPSDQNYAALVAERYRQAARQFPDAGYESKASDWDKKEQAIGAAEQARVIAQQKATKDAEALNQIAIDKRKELQDAASARRDAEQTRAKLERDSSYATIDEQYEADRARLQEQLSNKQITGEQYKDANSDLGAAKKLARYTVEENYKAITNGASTQFKVDMDFAKDVYPSIKSGKTAPTAKLALPKYTPPTTKAVNYAPSDDSKAILQAYEEANPREEKVKDTRTAEEIIAEMRANAPIPRTVDRTPLPGSKEYKEMSQASDFVGPSGLTREQANDLAQQFLVYGNIQFVNDKGLPTLNQVGQLSDEILNEGWQATYSRISPYANFNPQSPQYIDRSVAQQFAKDLFIRGGYAEDSPYITSLANNVQRNGFDKAVEAFLKVNPGVGGRNPRPNAQDMTNYINANNTALEKLNETTKSTFNTNVQNILKGEDFSFGATNISKDDYLDFILGGKDVKDLTPQQKTNLDYWDTVFQTLGPEAAIGRYNVATMDMYGRMSFAEPQEAFQPDIYGEAGTSTQPFEPDIYGGTQEPTAPTTPTTGTPTSPYPTTTTPTAPTTGLPALAFTPGQIRGYTPTTQQAPQAPTTTYQPAPYTPPPALLQQAPERPVLSPSQELIGAPTIERPVGAPMAPLTAEQTGSTFVPPTQEDYYAYFGYTPEQLNAAQFLAEMEGAPRAGIGAQTVPVLPPAVQGATAPTGMKEGGSVQNSGLMAAAQDLSSRGRNGDKMLVHMTIDEVNDLQNYAQQLGGSLTINPDTGLPEANFLKRVGRGLKKLAVPLVAAFAAPYLPAIAGSTALTAGLLAGAGTVLGGGDLGQGLKTGLMAGLSASAAQGMGYEGIPGVPTSAQAGGAGALQSSGSAMGAGIDAGTVSLVPKPGELDYISSANKTLLGRTTDYLLNLPATAGKAISNMDLGDAAMLGYIGMSGSALDENKKAQQEYEAYLAGLTQEDERKRRLGQETFAQTLGAVPVRSGGRINLAGGGMTYAEGGGTTGPTNEPRMVRGTGDGMSDSVPATIEGVQEARLANDEFVIPADVVADLGNGSSSAGAQQLYDMMDRVRQARHGTTEQPPEINARKIMPA